MHQFHYDWWFRPQRKRYVGRYKKAHSLQPIVRNHEAPDEAAVPVGYLRPLWRLGAWISAHDIIDLLIE